MSAAALSSFACPSKIPRKDDPITCEEREGRRWGWEKGRGQGRWKKRRGKRGRKGEKKEKEKRGERGVWKGEGQEREILFN